VEAIERLEEELAVAVRAAANAEAEHGRLLGELTEARYHWAASNMAQQEWDRLLAEQAEDLRLCREHSAALERQLTDVLSSTSWRLLQSALAPYRAVRRLRG
jgi:hypothetical protein